MFKDVSEMTEVSRLLSEKGIHYYGMTPTKVTFERMDDFEIASAILADYDVEVVLNEDASETGVSESREVMEPTIGIRDILSMLKW